MRPKDFIMAATTTEKKTIANNFPKFHSPMYPHTWDAEKLTWKVEKTREKGETIDDQGQKIEYGDKWQIVPYYTYGDGKTERLMVTYDACPVFIQESKGKMGHKRKIFARYERTREICRHIRQMEADMNESVLKFVFEADCSTVIGKWEVSVPDGKKVVKVTYADFISAKLKGSPTVTVGGKTVSTVDTEALFLDEFLEALKSDLLSKDDPAHPEYQPCKFIEASGYPKGPKSDSPEDMAKYQRQKVEGTKKVFFFTSRETVLVIKDDKTLAEDAWQVDKNGKEYTTDYHVMKHVKAGYEAWVALTFLVEGFRMSIGKESGIKSLVLEEECKNGDLVHIRKSEVAPKENLAQKRYNEEFGGVHGGGADDGVAESRLAARAREAVDGEEQTD